MTAFNLLLLIYGLILNLNEFTLAIEKEENTTTERTTTTLRSSRHSTLPPSSTAVTTESESSNSALIWVLVALAVVLAIGLGIAGYVIYLKCCKKPTKKTKIVESVEEQPTESFADVLNHPSTFCEASTLDPVGTDVIGNKSVEEEKEESKKL